MFTYSNFSELNHENEEEKNFEGRNRNEIETVIFREAKTNKTSQQVDKLGLHESKTE